MKVKEKTKEQFIRELQQRISRLELRESEYKKAEKIQQEQMRKLDERVKELNTLYAISEIFEKKDISLEEVYKKVINLIPTSWQYPEITCTRIIVKGRKYKTANFKETLWRQTSNIIVEGENIGKIEVYYLKEKPEIDEGPFLKEERYLINEIAKRLGLIIERKKADKALRESEEKYRTLAENLNIGVFRSTPGHKGKFIEVNPAMVKMFGFDTKKELLEISPSDLYHNSEDRAKFNEKMLKDGFLINEESQSKKKNGTLFIASDTAVAVKDEKGNVIYYDGIIEDITERKKSEKIQKVLHNILEATTKTDTLKNLLERIHEEIGTLMDAKNYYVALYDEESDMYTYPYYVDEHNNFEPDKHLKLSGGFTDYVRKSEEPLLMNKKLFQEFLKHKKADFIGSPAESWIGVPLMSGDKASGVAVVQSYTNPDAYTQDDLNILTFVSAHIAIAIERKRAEEAIKASEEKYRSLTDNLNIGIYRNTVGFNNKPIEANPAMVKMFGFESKKEFLNTNIPETYKNPEERKKFIEKISKHGSVKNEEIQYKKKDGTLFIGSDTAVAVKDEKGKVLYYDGILEDITERKKMEEALRIEKAYFEQLFESAPEAIALLDNKSRVLRLNKEFTRIFGYTFEEVKGKSIDDLIVSKELLEEARANTEITAKGKPISQETVRKHKNGTLIDVSILGAPIKVSDEQVAVCAIYRDITERKKAEEALKVEKAYFEQLFKNSPEAVVLADTNCRIIRVNSEFTKMYGYTLEEAEGQLLDRLITNGELYNEASSITKRIGEGKTISLETVRMRKDGLWINVSILGTPIMMSGGQLAAYYIYRDITDRKKAEELLRKSEEKYRTLTENLNVGIYRSTVGQKGKFVEANPAMIKMYGYDSKEDFLSTDISDLYVNEKDRDKFNKKMLKDGFVKNEEAYFKKKDGSLFIGSDTAVAIKDERGKVLYYDGIIEDITERKKAEAALQESEERFRLLFQNASDGIIIADSETQKFMSANKKMLEMLGYSLKELENLSVTEIHLKKDLPRVTEEFQRQNRGEITLAKDIPVLRKNGRVFYADFNSTLMVLNGKKCLVGIVRDTTERKKLEEEKMQHSKLEAIHNMIVTLNHEMNQPLSIICSNAEVLLNETKKNTGLHEDLTIIWKEAWRLADLVRKTQQLKEIKITEYTLGTKMVDLNDVDTKIKTK
ncbi:hypothetical protein AMJ80_01255 [bacterium SM23_31]|nr:MAG: hypothetical protein AMJ80_01255 [bacterium SM23_31]